MVAGIGEKSFIEDSGAGSPEAGRDGGDSGARLRAPGPDGESTDGDAADVRLQSGTIGGNVGDVGGPADVNADADRDSPTDAGDLVTTPDADATDCGNGMKQAGEQCDDGNELEVDGCKSNCEFSDGLRAHWRFDDLTGAIAAEETARYPASLHGDAAFVSLGKVNGALILNQASNPSFAELENFTINRSAGTVSVWAQTTTTAYLQAVVWGGNGGDLFGGPNNHEFHIALSGGPMCFISGQQLVAPGDFCRIETAERTIANRWYHLVMTYRDLEVAPKCKFYVHGEEIISELAAPVSSVYESAVPHNFTGWLSSMYVGRPSSTSIYRWLRGYVDELMVFDRELSAEEIRALYEAQR